ncbi:MAG: hypothetical protein IPH84_17665 [Bacteroidales bacterium]|nr:hypothetical protein [Bacteroidales bacterium]
MDNQGEIYSTCRHSRGIPPYGASPTILFTDSSGSEIGYQDLVADSYRASATTINWFQDSTIAIGGGWTMPDSAMNEAVFRTDKAGNIIKVQILFENENSFSDATATFDNKLVLVAGIANNTRWNTVMYKVNDNLDLENNNTSLVLYDTACAASIVNDTIFLDCDNIVHIDKPFQQFEKSRLKISPNPATNYINIELPVFISFNDYDLNSGTFYHKWFGAEIVIYNDKGQVVFRKMVDCETVEQIVDVGKWVPGMYLVNMIYKHKIVANSKLILLGGN